jgi:hypothetical protein
MQTESTTYHTPVGDIEIKNTCKDDMYATGDSHLAPLWLVFAKHIVNTQNIEVIVHDETVITIITKSGGVHRIAVSNIENTWKSLQKVFADGVTSTQ